MHAEPDRVSFEKTVRPVNRRGAHGQDLWRMSHREANACAPAGSRIGNNARRRPLASGSAFSTRMADFWR